MGANQNTHVIISNYFPLQVFINFSKQQKELADDLEASLTELDRDSDPNPSLHHDYDEPLILLSDRSDQSATTSHDSDDDQILLA